MTEYAEIVVVTRAPREVGNMALALEVYMETGEGDPKYDGLLKKVRPLTEVLRESMGQNALNFILAMRMPVFQVGEILFLDGSGREVVGAGRKPDKWDVDVERVNTLDDAIRLSRAAQEREHEAMKEAR